MSEEVVAFKFLHTADWHLGKRFPNFGANDRTKLMRARLDAVDRILSVAESNSVDAVFCAGDLFDSPEPEREWWQGLAERFAKRSWTERPVFLLPGNHDPINDRSVYARSHPFRSHLPAWVQVIEPDRVEYPLGGNAVLLAIPCTSTAGDTEVALRLPPREVGDERIRIGMVHGQTFDIPGYQMNFPIGKDAAAKRGLDYLAIGDTHAFRNVGDEGPPTVYPSTPEQTSFGETDTGFVVIGFVNRRRTVRLHTERVAQWTWRTKTIRDIESLRDLCHGEDLRQQVLRLKLDMRLGPEAYREAEALLQELEGTNSRSPRVGILQLDRQQLTLCTDRIEFNFEDLPPVLRETAKKLSAELEGPDRTVAERALYHLYRLVQDAVPGRNAPARNAPGSPQQQTATSASERSTAERDVSDSVEQPA